MEFPLKPDFFPPVRLAPVEAEAYAARAEESARALLKVLRDPHWRPIAGPNRGVALTRRLRIDVDESADSTRGRNKNNKNHEGSGSFNNSKRGGGGHSEASACLLVCGTALVAGSVREVVDAIGATDTDEYRRSMAFLHEARFLDALSLCSVPRSSRRAETGATTIKWAAFRANGRRLSTGGASSAPPSAVAASLSTPPGSSSSRAVEGTDYCYLEHVGVLADDGEGGDCVTDASQRLQRARTPPGRSSEVGFVVQESIERSREVPSLAGFGLARGELRRAGTLVLSTDRPGVVQVSSVLQLRLAPAAPPSLERQLLRRVASVSRVELLLEHRRLARVPLVRRSAWVADELRRCCSVCAKAFALRRRKHHCRACGEVVCASCAPQREACVDSDTGGSARVCTKCVVRARRGLRVLTGDCEAAPTSVGGRVAAVSAPLSPSVSSIVRSLTGDGPVTKRSEPRGTARVDRRPYVRASSASSDGSSSSVGTREPVLSIRECGWIADVKSEAKSSRGVVSHAGSISSGAGRFVPCPELASSPSDSSSSGVSLSDLDAFDDLIAINTSVSSTSHSSVLGLSPMDSAHRHGFDVDSSVSSDNQQAHGHQESIDDVLERIRRVKADLSVLSTAFQTDEGVSTRSTPRPSSPLSRPSDGTSRPPTEAPESSGTIVDVDFISTSDEFNLLRPESLHKPQGHSRHLQDAGEESRRSNLSFFTATTVMDVDDDDDESDEDEDEDEDGDGHESDLDDEEEALERELESHGGRERSSSQAELMELRRQVEGLHRSLAIATNKLQTFEAIAMAEGQPYSSGSRRSRAGRRRGSRQSGSSARCARRVRGELDPAVRRMYDALVVELHELMGLPSPTPRPAVDVQVSSSLE